MPLHMQGKSSPFYLCGCRPDGMVAVGMPRAYAGDAWNWFREGHEEAVCSAEKMCGNVGDGESFLKRCMQCTFI